MKPEFATNRPDETVAGAINGFVQHVTDVWKDPFELCIASGYFNPDGYALIAEALERVPKVRLLLGAEPEAPDRQLRRLDPEVGPERAERARVRNALVGHLRSIEEDRDLLGFESGADAKARRLVKWLDSGRVEVRRLERRFLHGKCFLIATHEHGVLAGSSNFTYAGLARNAELNLGQYQPTAVQKVEEWFEEHWADAVQFELRDIYAERYLPHNPYVVYLRMLYERYGDELMAEAADERRIGIHLTSFQKDGVWRSKRILRRHGGVLIADGVGLGKSFIAGELMREAVVERRQRVLLVAPAALRDGPWRTFLDRHQLGIRCVSFEELSNDRQLNPDGTGSHLAFDIDDYAMIVIDEAHAYRNPDTTRAGVLRRLTAGTPAKDVVMLTATPVNNSLWDLYYLVSYFVRNDAAFADAGIPSLRDQFAQAMAEDPEDLTPERLFTLLDSVAVRRTRHFVKRYYPGDSITVDGAQLVIRFPDPRVRKVTYDLDGVIPGFFEEFAAALDYEDASGAGGDGARASDGGPLTLARYVPSRYQRDGGQADYREVQLAGLLRSGLLKRFESSAYAFARTCRKMASSHQAFLDLLATGHVASGEALNEWIATDSDDVDDALGPPRDAEPASRFHADRLRGDIEHDRALLLRFAERAEAIDRSHDPKLARLVEKLREIAAEAAEEGIGEEDTRNKRKVIVFTYYADTVKWIVEHLEKVVEEDEGLACYRGRIATVTGQGGGRLDALFGFAPRSMEAPPASDENRYDILVSTDVLAEGVNLQQARHIVNYDLPWNPMRLVQRHGRIDRIGSLHDEVWLRCFFPDRQLDALLGLEERLHRKIAQAAATIGVEDEVIPGSRVSGHSFAETREEIDRLRQEDPELFESGGERKGAYSGEEYRQELRAAMQDPTLAEQIRRLPWGSGTGRVRAGAEPGFVFCARVADHPRPKFAFVSYGDPSAPTVSENELTCLAAAHSTADTERHLSPEMHGLAYEAWAAARSRLYQSWLESTDPRNLQPRVPKAMREAIALLTTNPPPEQPQAEIERTIRSLQGAYGPRDQRTIREAMRASDSPVEAAEAVITAVRELRLEPPRPPEPLPVIAEDDVHVVCWMAIVPEDEPDFQGWLSERQESFIPSDQLELAGG